jgi:hypothetical protein
MAFVNLSLLFGGLLTAIPVVLHLVMRQQPKRLVFPALQFLRERRETNRRKLQLRHWLLLSLRCAVIVLLAMAFARPSVISAVAGRWGTISLVGLALLIVGGLEVIAVVQHRGKVLIAVLAALALLLSIGLTTMIAGALTKGSGVLLGNEQAPVAAVMIFDTSPRMELRFRNETRLEAAQEIGDWLIGQLPADSEVAVLDARPSPAVFAVDLSAARKAIDRLQMTGIADRIPAVIRRALELVLASEKSRREIYIFTDMSATSWQDESRALAAALEQHPEVLVYVIDVGAAEPKNLALDRLDLSAEFLAKSNKLRLTTQVHSTGAAGTHVVQVHLEELDPTLPIIVDGVTKLPATNLRAQQEITLEAADSRRLEFHLQSIDPGVHHGFVRIQGRDGLDLDNVRFFTVEVKEAWPVLVVAPANITSSLFTEAIAPFEFRQTGQARFECTIVSQSNLANRELDGYAAVCLLDPEPIPAVIWEQLAKYVHSGGGLAVFLGHNAQATGSFNEASAQELLGGRLVRIWRATNRDLSLAPDRYDHPVMAPFRDRTTSVPWNAAPVFRHWVLDPLAAETTTIAKYSNDRAALVEHPVGRGLVLTMTTPVTDSLRLRGRNPWNELPTSEEAWPYVVLVNTMMTRLTDSGGTRLNYSAGETATLANDPNEHPDRYQLFTPLEQPQEVRSRDGEVVVRFTEHAGAYRLRGVRSEPVVRGFSVNLRPEATNLTRISSEDLDRRLGQGRYQFARNKDEISLEVGEARVGREFYSHLMLLLVLILGIEHLMANRFYRKAE